MQHAPYRAIPGDDAKADAPVPMLRATCWSAFLHRCLTHCAFFMLCSSYLLVSSIPRMMAMIDFPLSLTLFLFPVRRPFMSVLQHFETDLLHYNVHESGCDLLVLSLCRSLILFQCFAYRNQTRTRSLMVSRAVFFVSFVLVAVKLAVSSARIHPLTLANLVVVLGQFGTFTLVRRRRIQAPRLSIGYADDQYSALTNAESYPSLGARTLLEPDSRFFEFEGMTIHYRLRRHPTSPNTICLLHGFAGGVFSWRQVWDALAESATVLAFDRPGFGLSSRPYGTDLASGAASPYSPRFSVDLTLRLLETFQLTNCALVGHSTGAPLALMVAKEAPPAQLSSLCLISYTEMTTLPSFVRSMFMSSLGKSIIVQLVRSELAQVSLRRSWCHPHRIPKQIIDDYRLSIALPNWTEALSEMVKVAEPMQCIESGAIVVDVPVVVVQGSDDRLSSTVEWQRLAQALQGRCRFVRLRDCGHIPQQEHPEALVEILRKELGCRLP